MLFVQRERGRIDLPVILICVTKEQAYHRRKKKKNNPKSTYASQSMTVILDQLTHPRNMKTTLFYQNTSVLLDAATAVMKTIDSQRNSGWEQGQEGGKHTVVKLQPPGEEYLGVEALAEGDGGEGDADAHDGVVLHVPVLPRVGEVGGVPLGGEPEDGDAFVGREGHLFFLCRCPVGVVASLFCKMYASFFFCYLFVEMVFSRPAFRQRVHTKEHSVAKRKDRLKLTGLPREEEHGTNCNGEDEKKTEIHDPKGREGGRKDGI